MNDFQLKKISRQSVPGALKKAEHYRLLNEPRQAESICRDILDIERDHQQALITLLLALTDQFGDEAVHKSTVALQLAERIKDEYERAYYRGIICERRATAHLESRGPGSGSWAYEWYRRAMEDYETAEAKRPAGNDDALLRWNTCARIIMEQRLQPAQEASGEPPLE